MRESAPALSAPVVTQAQVRERRPRKDKVMKSFLTILSCLTVLFATCSLAVGSETRAPEPNAAEPNKPTETASAAATVNGVDITESELAEQLKPQLKKISAQAGQLPASFIEQYRKQLRSQVLERMIIERLLDEEAKQAKIEITDEQVTSYISEIAAEQGLSLEDLKALVKAGGQGFEQWKQYIRRGLPYQKLMEARWAGKINVTSQDANQYYKENKSEFEVPEQVRASHILIKPDTAEPNSDPNQAKATARAKIAELLAQIKDGADFAELAKANSSCPSGAKGGDLNFFRRGQMAPPFEKAAFELEVGQVSNIVETRFGYHIIKVTGRKDAGVVSFEQARDDIIKMLTKRKQAEFAKEYIESLKAKADIVYREAPVLQKSEVEPRPPGEEPNSVPLRP